jgi:hypothetical protein
VSDGAQVQAALAVALVEIVGAMQRLGSLADAGSVLADRALGDLETARGKVAEALRLLREAQP